MLQLTKSHVLENKTWLQLTKIQALSFCEGCDYWEELD
jgi:hypothetical protein